MPAAPHSRRPLFGGSGDLEVAAAHVGSETVVIRLQGELDFANVHHLTSAVEAQLGQGRNGIRLDVSRLTFLDAAAMGAIVHAHHRCRAEHGSRVLIGVGARTARLLRIARLDQALSVADATNEARSQESAEPEQGTAGGSGRRRSHRFLSFAPKQ